MLIGFELKNHSKNLIINYGKKELTKIVMYDQIYYQKYTYLLSSLSFLRSLSGDKMKELPRIPEDLK